MSSGDFASTRIENKMSEHAAARVTSASVRTEKVAPGLHAAREREVPS